MNSHCTLFTRFAFVPALLLTCLALNACTLGSLLGLSGQDDDDDLLIIGLVVWAATRPAGVCTMEQAGAGFGGPIHGRVLITEIAYNSGGSDFIEIHNGTGAAINLADYSLRFKHNWDPTNSVYLADRAYTLPASTLAAGAYIAFIGQTSTTGDTTYKRSLTEGGFYPYLLPDGYIELSQSGATVDFVSTGTNTCLLYTSPSPRD